MASALLVVDLISTFDFEGGRALLAQTRRIVASIVRLRRRASASGAPAQAEMEDPYDGAARAYEFFNDKKEDRRKVVRTP